MPDTRDLADEVHQLLTAVQDWAQRFPEAQEGTHSSGECLSWCPICQFANVLRGDYPEVTDRLSEAAAAVASAMKALADVALTRAQSESERRPKPAPRVEHIHLDDPSES
ncbi:MAG TPA: hypothetical protein VE442_15045 [Jatrophihabitans sp.]|jgi:hypothetical protein|nr:hypothetical protein [Jatrophihabitans sp.]